MSQATRLQKLNAPNAEDIRFVLTTYRHDPIGFARDILQLDLDTWQEEFLGLIASGKKRIAIASGNNAGKTYAVSALALWFLVTRPQANIFATANTASQLYDVTMNTMRIMAQNSRINNWFVPTQGKIQLIDYETQFISAKPNNPKKPESIAGRHAEYFLQIVDESSAIEQSVWDALNGNCTTDNSLWVVIGNPTRLGTPFHSIWKKLLPQWHRMNIDTRNCKYASKSWINDLINEYGEDSDIVKVRVKGQFPTKGADNFISVEVLDRCYDLKIDKLVYYQEPIVLGVDVGRQGDHSVVTVLQGRKVHKILKYKFEDDLMLLGEKVRDIYLEWEASKVIIDVGGMGIGVHDQLKRLIPAFNIIGMNNASKSSDTSRWSNKRQENYAIAKEKLMEGVDLCEDHRDEITEEFTSMEVYLDNKARITVEEKSEIKKKIGRSPDVTDSLILALSFKSVLQHSKAKYNEEEEDQFGSKYYGGGGSSWMDR